MGEPIGCSHPLGRLAGPSALRPQRGSEYLPLGCPHREGYPPLRLGPDIFPPLSHSSGIQSYPGKEPVLLLLSGLWDARPHQQRALPELPAAPGSCLRIWTDQRHLTGPSDSRPGEQLPRASNQPQKPLSFCSYRKGVTILRFNSKDSKKGQSRTLRQTISPALPLTPLQQPRNLTGISN